MWAAGEENWCLGRVRLTCLHIDFCFFFFEAVAPAVRNIRNVFRKKQRHAACSPFPSTKAGARAPRYRYAGIGPRACRAHRVRGDIRRRRRASSRPRLRPRLRGLRASRRGQVERAEKQSGARLGALVPSRRRQERPRAFQRAWRVRALHRLFPRTLERRRVRVRSRPRTRSDPRAARRLLPRVRG